MKTMSIALESDDASLPLYAQLARRLARLIHSGAMRPGDRLPSVRDTARQEGVSVSTVMQALGQLEEQGLIQAKPKAGYFVKRIRQTLAQPRVSVPPQRAFEVEQSRSDAFDTLRLPGDRACFDTYAPEGGGLFDEDALRVALGRASRSYRHSLTQYNRADAGTLELRQAVARRALHLGCTLNPKDLVITASCLHAVNLCLRAVTKPGDVIAMESPTFFGYLDQLESLGLRALEIPSHPRSGISLPALQLALDIQPIKAVLITPTLSNPMGSVMPLAAKQQLVRMLAVRNLPLIEDVVFNDLLASDERRRATKAFDQAGGVMICGSFSKTLSPGIRLGWVDGGRWSNAVLTQKRMQGAATNVVLEQALADLLSQGSYEAHMRRLASALKQRLSLARRLIGQHFPTGTRVSDPPGGYSLWVEFAPELNTLELFRRSAAEGITFGPGQLFTASDRYRNCLRLSLAGRWGPEEQEALARIGRLAVLLLAEPRRQEVAMQAA
jgi:DNA-binding transcriptional MocR family regulator